MRDFQQEILANLLILLDYRPSLGSANQILSFLTEDMVLGIFRRCTGNSMMPTNSVTEHLVETTTVGPINKCIYCGKIEPEVKLSKEHEMPAAVDGKYILLKASC